MKQMRLPRLTLVFQVMWRNVLVFFHNMPIYAVVLFFLGSDFSLVMLLALPGFALVTLNLVWIGLVVAILCARFRDITPIITSVMQIAFFLTPVMWDHRNQRVDDIFIILNPFASFIELVRAPLLGIVPEPAVIVSALCILAFGYTFTAFLFVRARARIVYWV